MTGCGLQHTDEGDEWLVFTDIKRRFTLVSHIEQMWGLVVLNRLPIFGTMECSISEDSESPYEKHIHCSQ